MVKMAKKSGRSMELSLYISLYNIVLFAIHLIIFLKLVEAMKTGNFIYAEHFPLFCIGTAAQILDVVHGVLGITTTGIAAGVMQVFGRLLMLYVIEGNPGIHSQISTPILLFAWVFIELIRYPYYALRAWSTEISALTWLRYSAWILLYPLGLTMELWLTKEDSWQNEGVSLVSSLKFYYETGKHSLHIPLLDVTLNFGVIVAVLAFAVMPLVSKKLYGHMKKQRRSKLVDKKTE